MSKAEPQVFSPRILLAWIAIVAAVFALSLYLATNDNPAIDAVGPNAISKSAIGYAGFAELLRRRGLQVDMAATRTAGGADAPRTKLRIVTEPRVDADDEAARLAPTGGTALLVLPKWHGKPDPDHKGWIEAANEVRGAVAEWALARTGTTGRVVRAGPLGWWTISSLGPTPRFPVDMQLVVDSDLTPIVSSGSAVLVGQRNDHGARIFVLSDPDVLSNHGLFVGANADFAGALVDRARGEAATIVFDDRVRGRALPTTDNLFKRLAQPPFLAVAASVLAALAVLLAATMGRFGRAAPLAPALAAGKHALIANAARMVAFSSHRSVILERYTEGTIRSVARHFHAPPGLASGPLVEWLGRIGQARGISGDIVAMAGEARHLGRDRDADAHALVELAARVHRWRKDILDAR